MSSQVIKMKQSRARGKRTISSTEAAVSDGTASDSLYGILTSYTIISKKSIAKTPSRFAIDIWKPQCPLKGLDSHSWDPCRLVIAESHVDTIEFHVTSIMLSHKTFFYPADCERLNDKIQYIALLRCGELPILLDRAIPWGT
jgi:hypothetical protein